MDKKSLFFLILLLVAFVFRISQTLHTPTYEFIDFYAAGTETVRAPFVVKGIIQDKPDIRRENVQYTVAVTDCQGCDVTKQWITVKGNILVFASLYPLYEAGDSIELAGKIIKPTSFSDFNYAGYLSRFDIYATMPYPKIRMLKKVPQPWFWQNLWKLQTSFDAHLSRVFPQEPSASLMSGLLLGSKTGLPKTTEENFQNAGISHVLAVSGYNITLIMAFLLACLRGVSKKISIIFTALGVIFFTLFSGASPSALRACLMGLLGLLAFYTKNPKHALRPLLFTAMIMILYNPKILFYDLGFQLSFLATFGLIIISPLLSPHLQWLSKSFAIRDSFMLTISAQIMTIPLILMSFSKLSLSSPLSNLLIAGPVIPLTMLFGFISTMTSYFSFPLSKLIAFPGFLLTKYMSGVANFGAKLPFSTITISWFSPILTVASYAALFFFLWKAFSSFQKREQRIRRCSLLTQQKIAAIFAGP